MARPCIYGGVCRAYIDEKGCILSNTCPKCGHYIPVPMAAELAAAVAVLSEKLFGSNERGTNGNL